MFKTKLCVILISLMPSFFYAQNLVPNPSFECGNDICDADESAIHFDEYACEWSCPTAGTTDIFSMLISNKGCYSATFNHYYLPLGSQLPRTGNRYAGIYTYEGGPSNSLTSYREYLQVKLKEPLIPGEYYCAEMYVSAADIFNYSCNDIGMFFSKNQIGIYDKIDTLSYSPQIVASDIIKDTVNWVRISGTFEAQTSAKYLIIGNFKSDVDTNVLLKSNAGDSFYNHAYYFIDDVSVEHLPKKEKIRLADKEICKGDPVGFVIEDFDDVTWTTLNDTLTILQTGNIFEVQPDSTTQYRVVVKNCNIIIKDTVKVTVDTFLKVYLGNDTTICEGTSIRLNAGTLLGSVYQWQDNSNDQYLTVNRAGNYAVSVSNPFNNCVGYDDINVSIKNPPKIELGKDTIVCQGFFPLKAGHDNFSSYLWSNGSVDSLFTPNEPGKYWVTAENRCGQASDSIAIFSSKSIFVPNVVTLNNDLFNNDFRVAVLDSNQKLILTIPVEGKLLVYNRWGKEIFSDSEYKSGWPSQTVEIDQSVYYFTFNYRDCPALKGWIHILK